MDIGVAAGAWRQFRRPCVHPVNRAGSHRAMALVAQCVDLRHVQQSSILRTMRSMAPQTSLRLDRGMLVDERPTRLRVALGADRVLIRRGLEVVVPESAVGIMAIAALDQTFVHLMVKRHIERRFNVGVALKTERRLRSLEQLLFVRAGMHAVAAGAADVGLGVRRAQEVRVRSGVATQARSIYFFG